MPWKLTKKYLYGRNKYLPKFTHLLSWTGIVIGVIALLVVSSVMNGLRDDMMQRIVRTESEIRVYSHDMKPFLPDESLLRDISAHEEVTGSSPVVRNELLIQKGDNVSIVTSYGIDAGLHKQVSELDKQIKVGSYNSRKLEDDGIILGLDLSLALGATVGEKIRLSSPVEFEPTPLGLLPKTKTLTVTGLFSSGMPDFDNSYVYTSLTNGRYFTAHDQKVDMIQVKITDPYNSRQVASQIQAKLGDGYYVEDWSVFDRSLFEAMNLEKRVMLTVLALMLIISGFNMACSSVRMVSEKQKEIGILKAIGMKTRYINLSFMTVNGIIGLTAILTGTVISATFIFIQSTYRIVQIPIPGFPMHWLPVVPRHTDFFVVALLAFLFPVLATIIPLQKIRRMAPIEVIKDQ